MARRSSTELHAQVHPPRRARLAAVAALVVAALIVVSPSTHAQGDDAETVLREGVELRREGKDAEAYERFRRVYEAKHWPRARTQMALAEQALGRWIDAERDLEGAMAEKGDAWIAQNVEALRRALATIRHHLAWLTVEANVENAELWIQDERRAVLPLRGPVRVVAGVLTVELRAVGYEPLRRTVEIDAESRAREVMTLVARAPSTERIAASPAPHVEDDSKGRDASAVKAATAAHAPAPVEPRRAVFWVTLGISGVVLGGAAAATVLHGSAAAEYNDDARCFYGGLTRDARCGDVRSRASMWGTLSTIGFVAGGALAITSAALLVWPRAAGASSALNVCSPTLGGVSCTVHF
jgi:hypothetical protein